MYVYVIHINIYMESAPNNNANITTIKISVKQMVTKNILIYLCRFFCSFWLYFTSDGQKDENVL